MTIHTIPSFLEYETTNICFESRFKLHEALHVNYDLKKPLYTSEGHRYFLSNNEETITYLEELASKLDWKIYNLNDEKDFQFLKPFLEMDKDIFLTHFKNYLKSDECFDIPDIIGEPAIKSVNVAEEFSLDLYWIRDYSKQNHDSLYIYALEDLAEFIIQTSNRNDYKDKTSHDFIRKHIHSCSTCGKIGWRKTVPRSYKDKSKNIYCSKSCENSFNNHLRHLNGRQKRYMEDNQLKYR